MARSAPERGVRRRWRRPAACVLALASSLVLICGPAGAQLGGFGEADKASFELFADRTAYAPGTTARLAARVTIEEHWHVNSHTPSYDYLIPTTLTLHLPEGFAEPRLTYPEHRMQKFAFTEEPIAVYAGTFRILAEIEVPADFAGDRVPVRAVLRSQACDDKRCLPPVNAEETIELVIGPGGEAAHEDVFAAGAVAPRDAPPTSERPSPESRSLVGILLLGLIGGLILNAMPCVLPVLSIKVFGLVRSAGQGRSHVTIGALATVAGILASFWALAAALVVATGAGTAVGWGVQFQQPGFVAFLAVVVVLFSLNLWGLFEIGLPAGVTTAMEKIGALFRRGDAQASHEALGGHFVSGLFATLMATPCSAPFLGTAVGFAVTQRTAVVFAVFSSIGLGMALPYLLLAIFPGAARFLPKPGPWMATFKGVMGFLLAGAAVWLFYVLAAQVRTEDLAFVQLALLVMALGVWLGSRARRVWRRRLAILLTLAAASGAVVLAAQASPPAPRGAVASAYHEWIAFDEAEAERLSRDEGRYVFVDVTAEWCLTCKTLEHTVLETEAIGRAFDRHDVVTMKADWTNRDDRITAFLAKFGKAAVPFYVLYRPYQDPLPFSELITRQSLLDALEGS